MSRFLYVIIYNCPLRSRFLWLKRHDQNKMATFFKEMLIVYPKRVDTLSGFVLKRDCSQKRNFRQGSKRWA
jgi:hypothetical protein